MTSAVVAVPILLLTGNRRDLIIGKIRQSDVPVLFKTTRLPVPAEQKPEPRVYDGCCTG
jgi:hypothetical protein